jgi:hypothetical protein
MSGLLGRDVASGVLLPVETGNRGCFEDRRPMDAIFPRTPTLSLDVSDLADNAGDGGDRSGNCTCVIVGRQ